MILKFKNFTLDKDCKIKYQLNGLQTLEFKLLDDELVRCEDIFQANNNEYIVKAVDNDIVTCELNLNDFKNNVIVGKRKLSNVNLHEAILTFTNWNILNSQTKKDRFNVEVEDCTNLNGLFEVAKIFNCTYEFDCLEKTIKVVDEPRKIDLIVSKDINLVSLDVREDSYEFYTRLYCFGKDNITISEVNGGKDYVEDFSYSNKVISAIWRDDRFTIKTNLKNKAIEVLKQNSKPVIEYDIKIMDLSDDPSYQKLKLHDEFTFFNYKTKEREQHRIIELVQYSDNPHLNEITVVSKSKTFTEYMKNFEDDLKMKIDKGVQNEFQTRFDTMMETLNQRFENLLINGHKIEEDGTLYFLDTLPKEHARNVLKIGLGGIMGSSNGFGGPYEVAISNNGIINASKIMAGEMDGRYIKGGTVEFEKLSLNARNKLKQGLITREAFSKFQLDQKGLIQQIGDEFNSKLRDTSEIFNEKTNNLQIGARNYIQDYGFRNVNFHKLESDWDFERIPDNESKSGHHIKATCTRAGNGGFHRRFYDLSKAEMQNKKMVYSVDIKCSKSAVMSIGVEAFENGLKDFNVTQSWQRAVIKGTVKFINRSSFPFYNKWKEMWEVGDIIYIRDPQLEEGDIATTPRPAPEDEDYKISKIIGSNLLVNPNLDMPLTALYSNQEYIKSVARINKLDIKNETLVIDSDNYGNLMWCLKTTHGDTSTTEYDNTHLRFIFKAKSNKTTVLRAVLGGQAPLKDQEVELKTSWQWYDLLVNDGKTGMSNFLKIIINSPAKVQIRDCRVIHAPENVLLEKNTKKIRDFQSDINGLRSSVGEVTTKIGTVENSVHETVSLIEQTKNSITLSVADAEKRLSILEPRPNIAQFQADVITGSDQYHPVIEDLEAYQLYTLVFDVGNLQSGVDLNPHIYNSIDAKGQSLIDKDNVFVFSYNPEKLPKNRKINLYPLNDKVNVKNVRIYKGDWAWWFKKDKLATNDDVKSAVEVGINKVAIKTVEKGKVIAEINQSREGTKISGGAIVDDLYGKTITGAIIQGNSKIKLGTHGFLQPVENGLQINAPATSNANYGVGLQVLGQGYSKNGKNYPKGLFIYPDDNFSVGSTTYRTNEVLLTVNGMIEFSSYRDGNGNQFEGYGIPTRKSADKNGAPIMYMYHDWQEGYETLSYFRSGGWVTVRPESNSDVRLKKNIQSTKVNASSVIKNIDFVEFDWKDAKKRRETLGVIAQQLEQLDPTLIDKIKDEDSRYILNSPKILMYALKGVQELIEQNQKLEDRISILESKFKLLLKENE